ncbi:MAG: MCP four helix bundle domain-containing protein [Paucibacter sp.]|nr:MCP four helix bundle domain-containing protein [Roseateles sp.]
MNLFQKLKLGPRLALAFAVVLLMMVIVSFSGVMGLGSVNARMKSLYDDRTVPVAQLSEIQYIFQRNRVLIMDMLARPTPENVEQRSSEIKKNVARSAELVKAYGETTLTEDEAATFKDFQQLRERYAREGLLPAADAMVAGNTEAAQKAYSEIIAPMSPPIEADLKKLVQIQIDVGASDFEAAKGTAKSANLTIILMTVAAIAIGAALAWAISASITKPVGTALKLAEAVAAGDLTQDVAVEGTDELAILVRALGSMNESLVKIVSQVRASSDSIATGSAQIATGNADLSQRTEEQASSLEETAASMEEMNATVKQNADTAQMATQLATSASGVAAKGGEVVSRVISTMEEITASSRKINDIIGVIDGIAFQTNILALNAAVEAARAGEQGRGFAVVAGEVRSLAQRSAQAAKEIKALIGQSVEKVDSGSALVGEAGTTMNEIVAQVRRVADLIGEIGAATREQTTGIGQVSEAVSQLDRVTQQNAALVEESAAAAESLKLQAQRMSEVVGVFKLSRHAAVAPAHAPAPTPKPAAKPASTFKPAVKPLGKAGAKPAGKPASTPTAKAAAKSAARPGAHSSAPAAAKAPSPAPAPRAAAVESAEGDWETF